MTNSVSLVLDVWDVSAVRQLLAEYRNMKPAFEAVGGTLRQDELFKQLAQTLAQGNRFFSWEEVKVRINSLNNQYFVIKDQQLNQTGSGGSNLPFFKTLSSIHANSVAVDPPITYSVGASFKVTQGNARKRKQNEDASCWKVVKGPLTPRQESNALQKERIEESKALRRSLDRIADSLVPK